MKSELIDKVAEIIPDPLVLVNVVSRRVAQLNAGKPPLIPTTHNMGAGDIALTEIIEGKLRWFYPEDEAADNAAGDDLSDLV